MTEFDVSGVARVCQGAVEGTGVGARVERVVIDSRDVRPGDLFVALPGARTHGHVHVADALRRGAVAAIVEPGAAPLPEDLCHRALVRVKFPRKALGDLATAHRRTLQCPVIAITGSNGKSSTRKMVAAALAPLGKIVQSPKSFNNDLGVPLTILSADRDTAALVVEMGTNARGEIRGLCGIAQPDMGLIVNVAAAHLEGLVSIDGVAREKGALAEFLPEDGLLFLNADDDRVAAMSERTRARVVSYGLGENGSTIWGCRAERTPRGIAVWVYGKMRLFVPVMGLHNARSVVAAFGIALSLGVAPDAIRKALRAVRLPKLRLESRSVAGIRTLFDCYNANPASLRVAVDELDARAGERRRVLVLGDMNELGAQSTELHQQAGRDVATRVDVLWCIGPRSRAAYEGARAAGMHPEQVFWSPDVETALRHPAVRVGKRDMVLLKASRAMALERMAPALGRRRPAARRTSRAAERVT